MSVLLLGAPAAAAQQAPDLTRTNLTLIDTTENYNLGPTGMRGWIYSYASGYVHGPQGRTTSFQPWQILVVSVADGTPAAGLVASNDVILGVSAGAAGLPVPPFTNDSRKSLGWAIGAAEAGDGKLHLKRWRAGVTSDVTLPLWISNTAYGATAPYNCPKSALLLSNACNVIAGKAFNRGVPGDPVLGLALLASGNTNYLPQVRTYARSIAPANLDLRFAPGESTRGGGGLWAWDYGYQGVFLAEYFLLTGDTNVLHGLNEYVVALAQAQSRYGTYGHRGAVLNADGSFHGTIPPYGPVNSAGLAANLALVLGKKALRAGGAPVDPEIDPAIARAANFFGFYVQKGNIPYGEHEPWPYHAGNGKESLAALLFATMGDRPVETEYWTRMVLAGYNGREYGHTGQGFSYLWGGLAANVGGTNAAASYLAQIRWHLDLQRRCDGSFAYDGQEQFGGSATYDYWNTASYYGLDPTACYVLTYAVPARKLYLTGRNANPTNELSGAAVSNAIAAGVFDQMVAGLTTSQLFAALGDFDPLVRSGAASELGLRAGVGVSGLIALAGSTNAWLRQSACEALGVLQNTNALPVLGLRLTDPDIWVRAKAAKALRKFTSANASKQLTTMLTAFTTNATDPNAIDWSDPIQLANGFLSHALFGDAVYGGGNVASYTAGASKSLLYPAVRAGLRQPDSITRYGTADFVYDRLTLADVQALAPEIIDVAAVECQADTMWSMDARARGISTLAKHRCAEGIPVGLAMLVVPDGFGWNANGFLTPALNGLTNFGDAARWTLPTLRSYLNTWDPGSAEFTTLAKAIAAMDAAVTSPAITNLYPVALSQVVATTNATAIALHGSSCRTNAVTFLNVTAPAHGLLGGLAPNLTYTPQGGFTGLDRFTFQVADRMTSSAPATVSIIVGAAGAGMKGEYFDNPDFTNLKFTRRDPQVAFDWGAGSPSNAIAPDTFSVRWSGVLLAPESGTYMFSSLNSDGVRFYLNGNLVIDDWADQARNWTDGIGIQLNAGQQCLVQMDYYDRTGDAAAKLKWTGPSFAGSNGVPISREWIYDTAGMTNLPVYAYAQSLTMLQNTSTAITLGGSVNATGFAMVSGPAHGSLGGAPPWVTYTPATNYSGADSFTFTASDGASTSAPGTVSIGILAGSPVSFYWTNAASGAWSTAANWTNSLGGALAPAAAGQPFYQLHFNKSGAYTATNDLTNGFALNQLNFAAAVTLAGSAIRPAGNGPLLPQINQHSANAVGIGAPLDLAATTIVGGTGGGSVTISNLISGPGGLQVHCTSGLRLCGLGGNTYTGGTVVNAGTLIWGVLTNGISPPCDHALGTGPVTLNGATIEFERASPTNALILNGGTFYSANGWGVTWKGPVTVHTNTTLRTGHNLAFSGNIAGAGGFTKTDTATLTLSGTNSYTGANLVQEGTWTCTKPVSLSPGRLLIGDGATVNLNYTGTRTIAGLSLGGTNMPGGVYGSLASPATNKDGHFAGNGTVTVAPPPAASFTATPTNGYAPLRVVFTDTSTGAITNRQWTFGDGHASTTSALTTETNFYANPGLYTVTLVARGGSGASTNVQIGLIAVDAAPVPVFAVPNAVSVHPSNGTVSLAFAASNGLRYRLVFKDDLVASGAVWTALTPPMPDGWTNGGNAAMTLQDTTNAGVIHRFFRIEAKSLSAP